MFYYYFGGKLPKENVLCDQDSYFTWNALLRYITRLYVVCEKWKYENASNVNSTHKQEAKLSLIIARCLRYSRAVFLLFVICHKRV